MESLEKNNWFLRRELGKRIRNQLKVVPELQFFLDDSLEYIDNIDSLLKE
jgi:ribosome-binding factor A